MRHRSLAALVSVLIFAAAATAAAAPSYTFDTDPIRLGMKALEEGRLSDAEARFEEALAGGYEPAKARYGQARVAVREGRHEDAGKLYRQALEERSREKEGADYPEARAGLGLYYLRKGRDAEAAAEFERALTGKPRLWEAVYGQARLQMKAGRWAEARELLDQGKKLKDLADGADLYHHGAALYELGAGTLSNAETEALLALALNPAESEYSALVSEVYQKKGVPELAISSLEQALTAPGATPGAPAWHNLAKLYMGEKRYNEARDAYLKALAADSTYVPALHDLGRLYRMAGQNDMAARVYLKAAQMNSQDLEALIGLSETALEARQEAQALDAATKAMAVDSLRLEVRLAYARAGLGSRDRNVKARASAIYAALPESLRTEPKDLVRFASSRIEAKDYAAAGPSLDAAIAKDPSSAEAWFQKGLLFMNTQLPDSAVRYFGEAARLDSTQAVYPLNQGIALLRGKRNAEAIAAFRSALAVRPDLTTGRVLLAQALVAADSLKAAETEYRKVTEQEPGNAAAWRGLGYCMIRKANYREAARAYRSAADADPSNADSWAGLGNANLGLKDLAAAQAAFDRARAIDPENPTLKKGQELLNNARKEEGP